VLADWLGLGAGEIEALVRENVVRCQTLRV
jgi:hypothetical protein